MIVFEIAINLVCYFINERKLFETHVRLSYCVISTVQIMI